MELKRKWQEDFSLCNMILHYREPFGQLYEDDEETEIKEVQQWIKFILFSACTGYNHVHI
jgi:hypothetical protein